MENHRPVFQNLLTMSEALIGVCHELLINNDVVMVIGEVEEVKRRWEALNTKVLGGEKELRNSNKTLALVCFTLCKSAFFYSCNVHFNCRNACLCEFFFCQSVSQPFINSVWHTLSWFLAQFVIQRVRKAVRQSSN